MAQSSNGPRPGPGGPRDLLDLEWRLLGGLFLLPHPGDEDTCTEKDSERCQKFKSGRGHEFQRLNQEAMLNPDKRAKCGL